MPNIWICVEMVHRVLPLLDFAFRVHKLIPGCCCHGLYTTIRFLVEIPFPDAPFCVVKAADCSLCYILARPFALGKIDCSSTSTKSLARLARSDLVSPSISVVEPRYKECSPLRPILKGRVEKKSLLYFVIYLSPPHATKKPICFAIGQHREA